MKTAPDHWISDKLQAMPGVGVAIENNYTLVVP